MNGRAVAINNLVEAKKELFALGVDSAGIEIMAPKSLHKVIKLNSIKPVAANIIKQEMLSLGGEAATAYGSINHSVDQTDLLVFGTLTQLAKLVIKLKQHQFGLPQLALDLSTVLNNDQATPATLKIGNKTFDFSQRTYIMGVLNVTPDSFSDGGKFINPVKAIASAVQMGTAGADIIDVGGESTRPGAATISTEEEIVRVVPVIEKLAAQTEAIISIDTTKALVAAAAIKAGAKIVNDISGLRFDPHMAQVIAENNVSVCLMHIKGQPHDMQIDPSYSDLMGEIIYYLQEGLEIAKEAGILQGKIMVDPGIGFGKTVSHNLEILKRLKELKVLGCPILVGTSRKSVIGEVLGLSVGERLEGTAATVALAIANGANIVRVHDVAAMARVAKMTDAIVKEKNCDG